MDLSILVSPLYDHQCTVPEAHKNTCENLEAPLMDLVRVRLKTDSDPNRGR
jgi:hypothetical protein